MAKDTKNNQQAKPSMGHGHGHGMGGPVEKPKNLKKALTKLMGFLRPYWWAILIALIAAAVGSIFQIVGPELIKELTDHILHGMATQMDFETINQTAILLLVLYGLSVVLTYLQSYIMVTVTQKISRTLRQEIVEKLTACLLVILIKSVRAMS